VVATTSTEALRPANSSYQRIPVDLPSLAAALSKNSATGQFFSPLSIHAWGYERGYRIPQPYPARCSEFMCLDNMLPNTIGTVYKSDFMPL
jgi:hypothetical protein